MARVLRPLTHVAAAAAALVLACSAVARADPDTGPAYFPDAGSAYAPNTAPAYAPGAGSAYAPTTGSAYAPDAGSTYAPNPGSAYTPDPGMALAPDTASPLTPDTDSASTPKVRSAYIYVSTQSPERLYLIDSGKIVFQSLVNTGIRVSPTRDGEFRVFASYPKQTMKGTDPRTFQRYNDPNVPYVMYFDGGRAIHGFPRSGYGYPQSFGCVELPVYKARELYQRLQGGLDTKVIVASQRPALERSRAGARPSSFRRASMGSEGQNPSYRDDVAMAAGTSLRR
jgi:lipoprotein-anchoring transpeptidase ErfK/SrfK